MSEKNTTKWVSEEERDTPGWTVKNAITLAIFTAIIFVVMMICTIVSNLLFTPIGAYYAAAGLSALLAGPFYMVMADKINRRGVVFLLCLITGLLFLAIGQIYTFVIYVVFGIIGELCMGGKDAYQKFIQNVLGFFCYMVALSAGGFVPMILFREQYLAWYETVGNADSIAAVISVYGTAPGIAITVGLTAVGTISGCLVGRRILNRHVKKARI